MSKVSEMSLKEILDNVDLIMRGTDIVYFCKDPKVIKEFMDNFAGKTNSAEEINSFFLKHEDKIDKEKLILVLANNYTEEIEILERKKAEITNKLSKKDTATTFSELSKIQMELKDYKDGLKNILRFGKGIETFITFYYYDEKEKRFRVKVVDSREIIDGKRVSGTKNLKRFDEIDSFFCENNTEGLGLEFVLQSILITDLYNIFPTENFGMDIRAMLIENEILRKGIKTRAELEELRSLELYEEYNKLLAGVDFQEMLPSVKQTLREYSKYLDMDKLLLICAYRFNEALESEAIRTDLAVNAKEILRRNTKKHKES